ncbi:nimrod A [Aphomia sociella]
MCVSVSPRTISTKIWCVVAVVTAALLVEVATLNGANVCMVKQKYNITKRVKYRAPMSVRTYEWCFNMPPRCSKWSTEMRDLTRLETEERTAEVAICCPGYKMQDISCIPICPNGKTGPKCSDDCPINKWGPNCIHDCKDCSDHGSCSPVTGECVCKDGWQGESCESSMSTTTATAVMRKILTTIKATTHITPPTTKAPIITTSTSAPETTTIATRPPTTVSVATSTVKIAPIMSTTVRKNNKMTSTVTPLNVRNSTATYSNVRLSLFTTMPTEKRVTEETKRFLSANSQLYNKTKLTSKTTERVITTEATTSSTHYFKPIPTTTYSLTSSSTKPHLITTSKTNLILLSKETKAHTVSTRKPETTMKAQPTTLKFKPKEIWIRPAQKGESPILEIKSITNYETHHVKHKSITKKELTTENTTPKTIIVSIIPTSVSYATFKKIALANASYMAQKNSTVVKLHSQPIDGFTKSMSVQTSTSSPTIHKLNTLSLKQINLSTTTNPLHQYISKSTQTVLAPAKGISNKLYVNSKTNSMSSTLSVNLTSPNSLTTISSINTKAATRKRNSVLKKPPTTTLSHTTASVNSTIGPQIKVKQRSSSVKSELNINVTVVDISNKRKKELSRNASGMNNNTKMNVANANSKINTVTDQPKEDEEIFHILTEPEHITAVMGEKGTDRTSVDLVSVISIAGGVMMAIITVAVIIVMIERCKRPRYEDVRKINDIRMQVMIDNNDVPPPYVRSIFHTPLPDPPSSEKCHYQPISTLDRNLKQFMRPVVVQTISPVMLENFRGILECHYDHLPRRNHEFGTLPVRGTASSVNYNGELRAQRAYSVTDSTIEALKCEAKLDVIDTTTAEPLYAEIPCWRPPSEHAIEIINTSGEAVTEL